MSTYTRRLDVSLFQSGLTGTLGYTVRGVGGATLVPRTTAGIAEDGTSANYWADVPGWDTAWTGSVVWDAGAGTLAREAFVAYTPQTGDASARIGLAGAGLTALGDARLANLDATVGSRLATTGYTAPPADYQRAGSAVILDLTQPLPDSRAATIGGALAGAWATGWGRVVKDVVSKLLRVWGPGNATASPSLSFDLDNGANPSTRTPQ
jgi:hypothetical protein